jgi:ubiquinone/menaquinone biosynthesis C-methylase UbiE
MSFLSFIRSIGFNRPKEVIPSKAYDAWSGGYDNQPDNLMIALDEQTVSEFLENTQIRDKIIVDIGCGTGRHWKKILDRHPSKLVGYDVSEGMLSILRKKFPGQETYLISGNKLTATADNSIDICFSTLTIAHIENIQEAFREWERVLKPGGQIFFTDFHPEALEKGAKRTFQSEGKTISVKNYVHSIDAIRDLAGQLNWSVIRFTEMRIDENMRPWYAGQNALHIYEKFKGVPIIYGLHLKKENGIA